jgi:large subunit ribosomal protein L7A
MIWGERMLQDLAHTRNRVVGLKQTLKAIHEDAAVRVYLAEDVDGFVHTKIVTACGERGVTPVMIPSMAELGSACGIDVGAAVAAIIDADRIDMKKNG